MIINRVLLVVTVALFTMTVIWVAEGTMTDDEALKHLALFPAFGAFLGLASLEFGFR